MAFYMQNRDKEVARVFDYLELRNMSVIEIGYEVHIETAAAMKWLAVNRPNIHRSIVKED